MSGDPVPAARFLRLTLLTLVLLTFVTQLSADADETDNAEPGQAQQRGSIFPPPVSHGEDEETYRVWKAYWSAQEADFPFPPDDSWKERMRASFEDYVHPEVILHNVPNSTDRDSWAAFGESLGVAYPDSQTTFELVVVEGDTVAALWTYRGTHLKPLGDVPPSGKKIEVSGAMFSRIKDGKIVEHWSLIDKLSWLKQLGLIDENTDM